MAAFAFHVLVAVGLFTLIGGAAALLDYYTKVLAGLGMSPLIVEAIKATEYFLFAVDLICFVVYISRETWLLLRSMTRPDQAVAEADPATD
ncbi:MAG: hypothetical protein WDN04_16870 [Rhodospirillales bacterium]